MDGRRDARRFGLPAALCTLVVTFFALGAGASADTEAAEGRIREELEAAGVTSVPESVIKTLSTLRKIDGFPIYTMTYYGPYIRASQLSRGQSPEAPVASAWACSLFAALGDPYAPLFGRNFDWNYSPLLVLFLVPESGYRSVISVDVAYLVDESLSDRLDQVAAPKLLPLLDAPFLPFDGMNEAGLAVAMASVDYDCGYPSDPGRRDVGDLVLMREVLEANATLDGALTFLEGIDPVSQGGPNMHYLIADTTPAAALIEYHEGQMYVFRDGDIAWQVGTNFPVVLTQGELSGRCWRYDRIEEALRVKGGRLSRTDAMSLLEAVATNMTQWSIVYALAEKHMYLCVERRYDAVYDIALEKCSATPSLPAPVLGDPTLSPAPLGDSLRGCVPTLSRGSVDPAVAVVDVTFAINGVEETLPVGHPIPVRAGDRVSVLRVTLCQTGNARASGNVCVHFSPVDADGWDLVMEGAGTHLIAAQNARGSLPGPEKEWIISEAWSGFAVVVNHWTAERGADLACADGLCERDDYVVYGFSKPD